MTSPTAEYSPSQISAYLDLIDLPRAYRPENKPIHDFNYLNALFAHQISTIPYENLSLHYARDRQLFLDPQHLFNKVMNNGRGGYCMEVSIFFYHMLKSLGFMVYMSGVRIRLRRDGVPEGLYVGFRHIVNIVTLASGEKYHVDIGFGGDGATKPLPLPALDPTTGLPANGQAWPVTRNIGTQDLRLVYDAIPDLTDASQRVWIYQYRNGAHRPWNSYYCFTEHEFVRADFEIMNYYTNMSPDSFQRTQMLVVKFLRREEGGGEDGEAEREVNGEDGARRGDLVYGKVLLIDDVVKQNLGGRTQLVQVCKSEAERIRALEMYFGIVLTQEQREGIKGYVTEIKERSLENMG